MLLSVPPWDKDLTVYLSLNILSELDYRNVGLHNTWCQHRHHDVCMLSSHIAGRVMSSKELQLLSVIKSKTCTDLFLFAKGNPQKKSVCNII